MALRQRGSGTVTEVWQRMRACLAQGTRAVALFGAADAVVVAWHTPDDSAVRLGVAGPDRRVAGHVRALIRTRSPGTDQASQIAEALATGAPTVRHHP